MRNAIALLIVLILVSGCGLPSRSGRRSGAGTLPSFGLYGCQTGHYKVITDSDSASDPYRIVELIGPCN